MAELVLHGIRLLAKQFLGTILDIEVDQSVTRKPKARPPVSTVDYLGPRTSGDGSSHTNINKIALSLTAMKFPPLPENNLQLETTAGLQEEVGGADNTLQRSLLDPIQE